MTTMGIPTRLIGHLLAANPRNPQDELGRSTILIVDETPRTTIGIQLNSRLDFMDLSGLSGQLGITYPGSDPLYFGGSAQSAKIHMVHSLDWRGMSTLEITDHIGLTSDIGILAAIAGSEGPTLFRACAGFWYWETQDLMQQIQGQDRRDRGWELVPATLENVFGSDGRQQWVSTLEESARQQVRDWLV